MNKQERQKLSTILSQAGTLLNGQGNGITDLDLIHAILGDLGRVLSGRSIEELGQLIRLDTCPKDPTCVHGLDHSGHCSSIKRLSISNYASASATLEA